MQSSFTPTDKTTITRIAKRGHYDTATIYPILDEGLVCHISYCLDGQPFMIPMGYCRIQNTLYIHGSVGSHFFRQLAQGVDVCVCVTFVDALILARSAFHHSVNYRSVVCFGKTRLVESEEERWLVLERFTEHIIPGRWAEVRQPNASEMKKTMVLAIEIEEASAKVRAEGVNDDPEDTDFPVWAGVVPLSMHSGTPAADAKLSADIQVPAYVREYKRR